MVKYDKYQNLTKSCKVSELIKSRSRLNADGGVNLYSSRCMHDPCFMALALIVSEKMTKTQKLDKSQRAVKIGQN